MIFDVVKPHKKQKHSKIKNAEPSQKFKEIYQYVESKYGKELEKNRIKSIISSVLYIVLFFVAFFVFILLAGLLSELLDDFAIQISGIISLCIGMFGAYYYTKCNAAYKESFKNNVIKNFVKYINPALDYYPDGGLNMIDQYKNANFDNEKIINVTTDDYIKGIDNNNVRIEMANIFAESKHLDKNIVYEGIFSATQINTHLNNEIKITKNKFILNKDDENVLMDSQEFEKYFDVSSESNILAMQILTHDIMNELVNFYKTYNIDFEILFKDNNIYIRFKTGIMFEVNLLKKSCDIHTLWIYYSILSFVTNLTIKINKVLKDVII